ncbi:MAG TPA: hypothetical protein VMU51_20830 [Mycobacteriales bacterium]|nr:hypothetical protein [Mycobacteriales bacterium]
MRITAPAGRAAFALLAGLMLTAATAATAGAAPPRAESVASYTVHRASAPTTAERDAPRTPAAADSCPVTRGAFTGFANCGTLILDIERASGIRETFVIGTNLQTYHIWQRFPGDSTWSGWKSLGGAAIGGVLLWDVTPTIYVRGTDFNLWCNRWSPAGWSGWFIC